MFARHEKDTTGRENEHADGENEAEEFAARFARRWRVANIYRFIVD